MKYKISSDNNILKAAEQLFFDYLKIKMNYRKCITREKVKVDKI